MRTGFLTLALLLGACAVQDTPKNHQSQPHIAPPAFPVSDDPADARFCGVRMVGGGADVCEAGEFCRRTIEDICGAADAPGICSPIPEMCTMDYAPVCGCDGNTYSNECAANAAGVSAASYGECGS